MNYIPHTYPTLEELQISMKKYHSHPNSGRTILLIAVGQRVSCRRFSKEEKVGLDVDFVAPEGRAVS